MATTLTKMKMKIKRPSKRESWRNATKSRKSRERNFRNFLLAVSHVPWNDFMVYKSVDLIKLIMKTRALLSGAWWLSFGSDCFDRMRPDNTMSIHLKESESFTFELFFAFVVTWFLANPFPSLKRALISACWKLCNLHGQTVHAWNNSLFSFSVFFAAHHKILN